MSDSIREILEQYKTLAVVGLSSKFMRPSHGVSEYMQEHGYRIIPVNPQETNVLGEKSYASLDEVSEPFDVVVIFRRPELFLRMSKPQFAKVRRWCGCRNA